MHSNSKSLKKISCATLHCITFQGTLTCSFSWYILTKSITTNAFKLKVSEENIMCHITLHHIPGGSYLQTETL